MLAREYRQRAWEALRGNWAVTVITYAVYCVAMAVCGALSAIGVGALLVFVLEGPFEYGLTVQSMRVVRGEYTSVDDLLVARDRFTEVFLAYLINVLLIMVWSLLFIIPGIIQAYSYSMTFRLMHDNPKLKPDEARRESDRLMEGHKWELFCLHLSFFGWFILSSFTAGILLLWVVPYMRCATTEFYETIIPPRAKVERVTPIDEDTAEFLSDMSEYRGQNDDENEDDEDIDPFDHGGAGEPFYVFEEERPRETTVIGDSIAPNKKPKSEDK